MNNRKKQNIPNAWKKVPEKAPSSANKFRDAQKKLQASVQKHIQDYESSSDEEVVESKTVIGNWNKPYWKLSFIHFFIDKITASYTTKGGTDDKLQRTVSYLKDNLTSGASTCLICISKVKRDDQVNDYQQYNRLQDTVNTKCTQSVWVIESVHLKKSRRFTELRQLWDIIYNNALISTLETFWVYNVL